MKQFRHPMRRGRFAGRRLARGTATVIAAAAFAAGCASTAPPRVATGGTTTEMSSPTGLGETVRGDEILATALAYPEPVSRVWPALQRALTAVGVPLDVVDPGTRTAGTPATRMRRTFGTTRVSAYLRCGGSGGVGDVADEYVVTLGVLATVRPAEGEKSTIQMQVAGSAKNPFNSVPARQCVSTGILEAKIDSTVKVELSR